MPRDHRSTATVFILVTAMLDVLGFGIVIPVLPHLVAVNAAAGALPERTPIGNNRAPMIRNISEEVPITAYSGDGEH